MIPINCSISKKSKKPDVREWFCGVFRVYVLILTNIAGVIHYCGKPRLLKGSSDKQDTLYLTLTLDLVLHMTEEALLWGIIPAVASAGHGLYEVGILEFFDKSIACVMTSLVAVHDGFVVESAAVLFNKSIDSIEDEIDLEAYADFVSQDLMRKGIEDC